MTLNELKTKNARLLACCLATGLATSAAWADDEWEWSPDEGYHREEWYDPSDWFNDDGDIDYEYDSYSYYDGYWDGYTWYDTYDYDDVYDTNYVWDADANEWVASTDYDWELGYNDEYYDDDTYSASYEFDDDQQNQDQSQAQQGQSQQSQQGKSQHTMGGTIKGFRKLDLTHDAGFQETHALAKLSLDNGETAVVDLGLASLLTADLSQGDKVKLRGWTGSIGGQRVFLVDELQSGGETVRIDRAFQMKGAQASKQQGSKSQQRGAQWQGMQRDRLVLEGEIADAKTVRLKGEDKPQTLAKISLKNGQGATVSLGSETSLEKLNLEKGDRIRVEGTRKQIEGRNVLMAETISVEGQQVKGG